MADVRIERPGVAMPSVPIPSIEALSPPHRIAAKSYRYLRLALIALLISLAAAVLYQSGVQRSFLASVSAYYYTPAQAIFVGALIGLGACMIALKGTTPVEDAALHVGGVFATVVAVVPTSRGADYRTALQACRSAGSPLLTRRAAGSPDCPTVEALADATRANVQNNVFALLATGLLAIVAALLFLCWDHRRSPASSGTAAPTVWGFVLIGLVWVAVLVARTWYIDWFVAKAHFIAAFGLLLSVLVIAAVNARRREVARVAAVAGPGLVPQIFAVLRAPHRYAYTWIAAALLGVALVALVMTLTGVITLFWLEIAVAALFAAFWTVQTLELDT